jgi:hypothetical protein
MELIDCVLSIYLFELYRLFRSGKTLYCKDQFQFKILYFFSRLKTAKVIEDKSQVISACFDDNGDPEIIRRQGGRSYSLDGEDEEEDGNDLCDLIDQLKVECGKSKPSACENCRMKTKENMKFQNLYKQLIEDIVKNLE